MKAIVLVCGLFALTACGTARDVAYDKAADAFDRYCSETIDADVRQKIVDNINARTDSAKITVVECE